MSNENVEKFEDILLTEPVPKTRVTVVSQGEVVAAIQPEVTSSSLEKSVAIEIENDSSTNEEQPSKMRLQKRTGQHGVCYLCDNRFYQEATAAPSSKQMVQACFCSFEAHHGCLAEEVLKKSVCDFCSVPYRAYKYGTILDFIQYEWLSFMCILAATLPVLISGLVILFRCWPMYFWYNWIVLFSGVFLSVSGTGFLIFFCKRMFCQNYPKFVARMGQVNVFPYEPSADPKGIKKPKRSELRAAYHKRSTGIPMDLTAGQKLLGHDRTHSGQMSSTPLEDKEQVRFHFETPAILV